MDAEREKEIEAMLGLTSRDLRWPTAVNDLLVELRALRGEAAAKLARRVELEDECARLDAQLVVARVGRGVAEAALIELRASANAVVDLAAADDTRTLQDLDGVIGDLDAALEATADLNARALTRTVEAERDRALAALAGLKEAVERYMTEEHVPMRALGYVPFTAPNGELLWRRSEEKYVAPDTALRAALAATPADLGARVIIETRAKALDDAADLVAATNAIDTDPALPWIRTIEYRLRDRAASERAR